MQELEVESELQAGTETQVFQLNHRDRDIQKVAFTYKTTANASGEKAHVELHGLKTEVQSQSDAYRNERNDNDNAEQTVDSVGNEIEQGANALGNNVDSVRQETQEAAEGIKNEMDTAANNASDYMERTAEDADSAVNQAGQELNDSAENVEDNVERGADRIGNEIESTSEEAADEVSETTRNTASGVADQVVKDMEGPEGQKIYMDNQSKYYYVNDEGKKVIIAKDQLKSKKVD
jgi:gas vesicle protein